MGVAKVHVRCGVELACALECWGCACAAGSGGGAGVMLAS